MKRLTVKISQAYSLIVALIVWGLFSFLVLFIITSIRDRARLIMENDNERIFNTVFAIRSYDDFETIIDADPVGDWINGFAVYKDNRDIEYSWGMTPVIFDERLLDNQVRNRYGRYVIPNRVKNTITQIMHNERIMPAMPRSPSRTAERDETPDRPHPAPMPVFVLFSALAAGKYIYLDIMHQDYWRTQTMTTLLFPFCEGIGLIIILYIRHLYLRNREYRSRIEAQKNLVVLGTAVSTLAHEIKNPLLSIRIQTSILKKTLADIGAEEIAIIEEEVDRLQALTYRVNDYLREAKGHPVPINCYDTLSEISQRLCSRNIVRNDSATDVSVMMDPDRGRSVFENIIRNALESGGDSETITAHIMQSGTNIVISIADRGAGISEENIKRIFDPFFTSKSTGTGIGLSISRRFVEAAGGTITLENRVDGGIVARIILPEGSTE
jgi:two-component system sensor histidine kinase HydH